MKRDGIDFGDPPPAAVSYIHHLEGKIGDFKIKVEDLQREINDLRTGNALWLVGAGMVIVGVSYWGLHPGWKLVPIAAALLIAGAIRYRDQQAWERRRFEAIMKSD